MTRLSALTLLIALLCVFGCIEPGGDDDTNPTNVVKTPAPSTRPKPHPKTEAAFAEAFASVFDGNVGQAEETLKSQLRLPDLRNRERSRALFWLGYCQELRGRTRDALAVYGRLERDFPKSVYGKLARERRALLRERP